VNWARFDPIPGRHGKNGKHSLPDPRTTRLDRIPEKRNRAPEGAAEIARRSRGTPRIANRLLRRVRDYAQVRGKPRAAGKIDAGVAKAALEMLEVDKYGFDETDRRLLLAIIEKYQGGPVGVNTLAAALAEEPEAIEEIYEPFLIQIGFLDRTPRGRVATKLAYEHFGIPLSRKQSALF